MLDPVQFANLKHKLEGIIDPNKDSLRYYKIGNNWKYKVEHIGIKPSYNPEDTIIF